VGTPPDPRVPVGSDLLPDVDHIVVVMMENHSFDNILGALGRGDVLARGPDGLPDATNPDGRGNRIRSFQMSTPCQLDGKPSQSWNASHIQFSGGTNQGFVISDSGPVAMGYWTPADLPFTNSLAATFPVADRYFSSVLAQTYPNRRYLVAGTSLGLIDDTFPTALPPNGTVFDLLDRHGISWKNYYSTLPTAGVFISSLSHPSIAAGLAPIAQYYADCASGDLPGFSLVDPDFDKQSEEDPQDIQYGDAFLAQVVNAVLSGPKWARSLLVWTYDEHGGYYDHVPPPAAVTPDDVSPMLAPTDVPGAFDRLGFRVPAGLVSPYARKGHVSHSVYDHTSVLRLVETKWNLPALTRRDAAANDLLDMVDFSRPPAFLRPPVLHAAADPAVRASCLATGPGVIPPASAVIAGH
jgi:phospholipase C